MPTNVLTPSYQARSHAELCADWLSLVSDSGSRAWAVEVFHLLLPAATAQICSDVIWIAQRPKGVG